MKNTPLFQLITLSLLFNLGLGCTRRNSQTPDPTPAEIVAGAEATAAAVPAFDTWLVLGLAYSNADQSEKAIAAYEKAGVTNPNAAIVQNNICVEYNKTKRWDLAVASCERALVIDPTLQLARNNLAFARSQKAAEAEKISVLEQAANSPDEETRSVASINLGLAYSLGGDLPKAIQAWERVPPKNSHYAVAQNNIASAAIQLRLFNRAREALARALKLEPENVLFRNNERWLNTASQAP